MSDLGRLFRLSAVNPKPLENFTTEALAIAIGYDPRPMMHALSAVDWTCDPRAGRSALATSVADIVSLTASTQTTLWPSDDRKLGYLDLVLHVRGRQQESSKIWVEVKVDAWESGNQLDNYEKHAALLSPSPTIITLGRTRVSPCFPCLTWSDILKAIDSVPDHHHAWQSLRDFLVDEKIARPLVPMEPVDSGACIDVIVDVNGGIRNYWPRTAIVWRDGALRKMLTNTFRTPHDLLASGGPLRYGLMPAGEGWEWGLVVTIKTYDRVPLDAQQMLQDADVGGLPQDWLRHRDRLDVLERRLPSGRTSSHDEIVNWFDAGLQQLRDARILDRYFAGLTSRQVPALVTGRPVAATDEHVSTTILLNAVQFAAFKHQGQRRKDADASPYINHCIGVAQLLAAIGCISDLNTLVAAVLHDTIEDTDTTADELEGKFGRNVRKIVEEVTDDKRLEKAVRKQLQIEHAPNLSLAAKAIKLADKISNVRDVTDSPPADWDIVRRTEYLDWTEKVVAGCRGTNAALDSYYDDVLDKGRASLTSPP